MAGILMRLELLVNFREKRKNKEKKKVSFVWLKQTVVQIEHAFCNVISVAVLMKAPGDESVHDILKDIKH